MALEQNSKGTIVFVHGAWCDGSVWTKALMPLAHEGYRLHAAQLPLETFEGDVAALTLLLDHAEGPVLLVGHSYAGAVVTAAGNHEKVKALAYVTAFAPEEDEVIGTISSMYPAQEKLDIEPDAKGFLWLTADFAAKALGQDLHRGYLNLAAVVQKPIHAGVFSASIKNPAWKHKPSSYLVTTEDRILAPETQHALAKRIDARTEEIAASHLVLLSQPEFVAQFVRNSMEPLAAFLS
ncbi:MAG: alpha/beta fold hydrolase [Janthinobacterium lividum]